MQRPCGGNPRCLRRSEEASAVDTPNPDASPEVRHRLRLTVAYDGSPFAGWQSQTNGNGVQDHLEAAFAKLCGGERIAVHGSGRTDAGVHARAQVAHVDVPDSARHSLERWRGALNAHLPAQIRVALVRRAKGDFHARFDATEKVYRYRIWNSPVLDPFENGRAWHFPNPLDSSILGKAAQLFVGKHDFAAFSANRGKPVESTVRTIRRATVRRRGALITLEFEGDGFLYKMVRLLTGALVRCAQGRAPTQWITRLLDGQAGKNSFAAPAEGLYLRRVLYGREPKD